MRKGTAIDLIFYGDFLAVETITNYTICADQITILFTYEDACKHNRQLNIETEDSQNNKRLSDDRINKETTKIPLKMIRKQLFDKKKKINRGY